MQATGATLSPEALEELLAPVALYPDSVLAQVLQASTNPQEVMDAGNWLVSNPGLEGTALDDAASKVGFTPPIRALIQFPTVVDMMCLDIEWTEQLGQAFVNDQAGVLDAAQRLRAQAKAVGNLQSSDKLKLETTTQGGEEHIVIQPADEKVVYVPQYDSTAAYAPPAQTTPPVAAAPATTTESQGHSTGTLIATGLLSFGAGVLVSEIFEDDDDDDYHYYGGYPGMWYQPMPYYPPYPYRPAYGAGFHPSNVYNRPVNYVRGNTVIVNQGNKNFRRDIGRGGARSPITAARPNRPELTQLNADSARGPKRPGPASAEPWKGQKTYAGAGQQRDRVGSGVASRATPKVQGSYAGARRKVQESPSRGATAEASKRAATRGDRGRGAAAGSRAAQSRPTARSDASKGRAFSAGSGSGRSERAASQRGRQSAGGKVPARAKAQQPRARRS